MGSEDKFLSMMTMFIEENRRHEEENKKRDDVLLQLLEKVSLQSSAFRHGEELITEMISNVGDSSGSRRQSAAVQGPE